jgi:Flp pilus assembly protein TadG
MRSLVALVRRFHADERGVFAVLFGVIAIVLIAAAGAVVDYTSMEQTRTRAQIALDSAVLGLAPTIYDDPSTDDLMATTQTLIEERLDNPRVAVDITDAFYDKPTGTLRITGTVTVPMAFMQLIGFRSLTANLMAEAKKSSMNLEVAVSLDNSGSMASYIDELQEGLDGLIEIVVNEVQEPTYSKMAIVPWSAVVNVGDAADTVRGSIPARPITSIYWSGPLVDITGATKANPVVITAPGHGYINGEIVRITGVTGMTQLNNKFYQVASRTTNTFALKTTDGTNVNGSSYSTFTGATSNNNDKVRKCLMWVAASSACQVFVESPDHEFDTGDYIRTDGNISNSTYRNKFYTITRQDADTYTLDGQTSTSTTSAPLSTGGAAWCTDYGCEWYRFQRQGRTDFYTWRISDCVTERATDTYTDAPPSTTLIGAHYNDTSGGCDSGITQTITPLTSDRDVLLAQSEDMNDWDRTSGHIGTAWAWYLLSPDWGYLWPNAESVPAAYDAENTKKIAVLMTDGEYNRQFCNGVRDDLIEVCDAPDDSTSQARELCSQMKDKGIVIYTVGFNIANNSSPAITMQQCATDSSKYFRPATGAELVEDFREIAQDITDLRLSQ